MDAVYYSIVEALIFSSDDVITAQEIVKAVKGIDGEDIRISVEEVDSAVEVMNEKYTGQNLSFRIIRVANGYLFATQKEYSKYVGYLSSEKSKRRLSQAALETLSIIAYKQPVTKPQLESIRGVNSDYILNTLLEKNLINIAGRADSVGRPLLYSTTQEFLKYFGLNSLSDLPKPREIEEIMNDEDFIEQKRKIMMNALEDSLEENNEESKDGDDQNQ